MDDSENQTIGYHVAEITEGQIAERFGAGFYLQFDGVEVMHGPFETMEAAQAAAIETVENSIADALKSALFGEAA